jgi:hypothetical protein
LDTNITSDECPDDPAVCDCGYHDNLRAAERSHQEPTCQNCQSWQPIDGDRHGMCSAIGSLTVAVGADPQRMAHRAAATSLSVVAYVTGFQAAIWTLPTFSCSLWQKK